MPYLSVIIAWLASSSMAAGGGVAAAMTGVSAASHRGSLIGDAAWGSSKWRHGFAAYFHRAMPVVAAMRCASASPTYGDGGR